MMRLLWAKAIDDTWTAMVVDIGNGQLLGGVAALHNAAFNMDWSHGCILSTEMRFVWKWHKTVNSVDIFERERGWERPPEEISNTKMLENRR